MAKLTIYLPDEIESKARKAAKAKGKSVSCWIADQVVQSLEDTWSKGVLNAAGAFLRLPESGRNPKRLWQRRLAGTTGVILGGANTVIF